MLEKKKQGASAKLTEKQEAIKDKRKKKRQAARRLRRQYGGAFTRKGLKEKRMAADFKARAAKEKVETIANKTTKQAEGYTDAEKEQGASLYMPGASMKYENHGGSMDMNKQGAKMYKKTRKFNVQKKLVCL